MFIISLFMERGAAPLLLLHPLGYFPIILPLGLLAVLLTKANVPFAGLFQIFISLTIAIGDPLLCLIHKIIPSIVPVEKYGFFNFEIIMYVVNPPKPLEPNIYQTNLPQASGQASNIAMSQQPSKTVEDVSIDEAKYHAPKNHSLFDFNKKIFWTSLEAHITGNNNQEQIRILENALNQNNTIFEEFIIRSLLMSDFAILKNLEAANIEAKKARHIFENNYETWTATIDYVNFPAESLFINNLHWVPIYPDSIRPDMDEISRKNAAIDMMAQYYEVFVTFSVVHVLLYSFYIYSGDREQAGLELRTGASDFTADSQLCSPIFHTMLGLHYKEKGDCALSSKEFKTALTDNIRARELFSLYEDESQKSLMDRVKYALIIWEGRAKSASVELDAIIPKRKNSFKTLFGFIFIIGLCFIAYKLIKSRTNSNSAPVKEIPNRIEPSRAKTSSDESSKPIVRHDWPNDAIAYQEMINSTPYEYEGNIDLLNERINIYQEFLERFPKSDFVAWSIAELANICYINQYASRLNEPKLNRQKRIEKEIKCYEKTILDNSGLSWTSDLKHYSEFLSKNKEKILNFDENTLSELNRLKNSLNRSLKSEAMIDITLLFTGELRPDLSIEQIKIIPPQVKIRQNCGIRDEKKFKEKYKGIVKNSQPIDLSKLEKSEEREEYLICNFGESGGRCIELVDPQMTVKVRITIAGETKSEEEPKEDSAQPIDDVQVKALEKTNDSSFSKEAIPSSSEIVTTPSQPQSQQPDVIYSEADLIDSLKNAQYIITGGKNYTIRWITVPSSKDLKIILKYLDDAYNALNTSEIIARSLSNTEAMNIIVMCQGCLDIDKVSYKRGQGGRDGLRDAYRALKTYLKGK